MQIQVNTDNHIVGSAELSAQVETSVQGALGRFGERITRVEVHLSDENSSAKVGDTDKRCVMEVRMAGMQPITVRHNAATLEQSLAGASDKIKTAVDRAIGQKESARGRG